MSATLFETIPLNESQQNASKELQRKSAELLGLLSEIKDKSYRETAIHYLEASVMFAIKGISREIR